MNIFKNQVSRSGLKINFLILFTSLTFFISSCAGKIVPEEDRIEATYNFNSISGFNYFEVKETNRSNRRNIAGESNDTAIYHGEVNGVISIGKHEIDIKSDEIDETFIIQSVRQKDYKAKIKYTYKTSSENFVVETNNNSEVVHVSFNARNQDFIFFWR